MRLIKLLDSFSNDKKDHRNVIKAIHLGLNNNSKRFKFFKQYMEISLNYGCNAEKIIENLNDYILVYESLLMLIYKLSIVNSSKTMEK